MHWFINVFQPYLILKNLRIYFSVDISSSHIIYAWAHRQDDVATNFFTKEGEKMMGSWQEGEKDQEENTGNIQNSPFRGCFREDC